MLSNLINQKVAIGLVLLTIAGVGLLTHLDNQARAAAGQPTPAATAGQPAQDAENLARRRQQLEQELLQVQQARQKMNLLLYERIKSIKRRQGLTPDQAKAFDDAYAADLAKVNAAEKRINAALEQIKAKESSERYSAQVLHTAERASLESRVTALEQRVAALEAALRR
jgi:polyhydroxyalkanoate synthesis regulator phasin